MQEYIGILKKSKIFEGLSESEIHSVINCLSGKLRELKKGEFLHREGDLSKNVSIVVLGELEIQKVDYIGNANIISILLPSDVVAVSAVFSTEKRLPFDVVSTTDSLVLNLNSVFYSKVCSNTCNFHIKIIENMLLTIADRNLQLANKIDILTKRTIREKLLAFLYGQSKKFKSNSFSISMTKTQLADFISVDRSAMSKELAKMADDGLIEFRKNYFKLKI